MSIHNVSITEHDDSFIENNVRSGRFDNVSEVFRAGLHLLQQQDKETKLECLCKAAEIGFRQLDKGEAVIVADSKLEEYITALGQKSTEEAKNL